MSSTLSPWISPVSIAICSVSRRAADRDRDDPRSFSRSTTDVPQLLLRRRDTASSTAWKSSRASLHELDVLERRQRERPRLVEQQADFARVVAFAQIGDGELGGARRHAPLSRSRRAPGRSRPPARLPRRSRLPGSNDSNSARSRNSPIAPIVEP